MINTNLKPPNLVFKKFEINNDQAKIKEGDFNEDGDNSDGKVDDECDAENEDVHKDENDDEEKNLIENDINQ